MSSKPHFLHMPSFTLHSGENNRLGSSVPGNAGAAPGRGMASHANIFKPEPENFLQILASKANPKGPYDQINEILKEVPRIITVDEIVSTYVSNSLKKSKSSKRIIEGVERIQHAYSFAEAAFANAIAKGHSKEHRKDGKTPIFAHSTRVPAMAACLGAGSHVISALLNHDVIEDCRVPLERLHNEFGPKTASYIALLTKPLLYEFRKEGSVLTTWVYLASSPNLWNKLRKRNGDAFSDDNYQERMANQFQGILNIDARGITQEMKVRAYTAKHIDAVDSLNTDIYLNPMKADIRRGVLISEIRHLEILAPGFRRIFLDLLNDRGYNIPDERRGRWKPGGKVVELPPPNKMSVSYLDKYPALNGYFIIYSDSPGLKRQLKRGVFKNRIRAELPNGSPADIVEKMREFFKGKGMELGFVPGESLNFDFSDGAGIVVWVTGIRNLEIYNKFKSCFEEFHGTGQIKLNA